MGNYYLSQQKFDKAIEQFQYIVDHPDGHPAYMYAQIHMNMALAWLQVDLDGNATVAPDEILPFLPFCRHIPEAIGEFGQALRIDPNNYWAHAFLAVIYRYQGNGAMADFHQKRADQIFQGQAE
jgi:tetratricopeptide (TPR) repeat protein